MASCLRHLNPKKTLFLLCDIQEKFRSSIPLFANLLENANKLTKAGKELDVALICSQQYPEKLGKICAEIDVNHAKAVIDKTQFSMLIPEFENKLKELFCDKPDDVVLYGLETHVCIEQTAIDLLERNINVFLVADCLCSRLNQDRDLALERLRSAGCVITSSESVIFDLMRDKNHPKFNVVRKFVNRPSADMQLSKVDKETQSKL
uniref:Isochorismatase domain-containing protein 1 n=1 Tax=Glossina morsitans morsitans TaxID=37546 RepID=A0A1B0GGC6_GLOMM